MLFWIRYMLTKEYIKQGSIILLDTTAALHCTKVVRILVAMDTKNPNMT